MFNSLFKPNLRKLYQKGDVVGIINALSSYDLKSEPHFCFEAISYLKELNDARAVEPLIGYLKYLDHEDDNIENVASNALSTLGALRDGRALDAIIRAYYVLAQKEYLELKTDIYPRERKDSCLFSCQQIDLNKSLNTFLFALSDSDTRMVQFALEAILYLIVFDTGGRYLDRDKFLDLVARQFLSNSDVDLKLNAIKTLYLLGDSRGVAGAYSILDSGDLEDAAYVAGFIKQPGDLEFGISESRWRNIVQRTFEDINPEIRLRAYYFIENNKDFRFIPDLLNRLSVEYNNHARYALGNSLANLCTKLNTSRAHEKNYFDAIYKYYDSVIVFNTIERLEQDDDDKPWHKVVTRDDTTLRDMVNNVPIDFSSLPD